MKSVGGTGLIIIGFLLLYLAISGKLDCFFAFLSCITGSANTSSGTAGAFAPSASTVPPNVPTMPTILNFSGK